MRYTSLLALLLLLIFMFPALAQKKSLQDRVALNHRCFEKETAQAKVEIHEVYKYMSPETQKTLEWYRNAKFGMFVHWGLYSGIQPWDRRNKNIPKDKYVARGKNWGKNFNPDEWTRLAKAAGMQWITLTSKHHDGFALYPSADEFDIEILGYKGDPIAKLKKSCKNAGLPLGFYYSHFQDWEHPYGGSHDMMLGNPMQIKQFEQYMEEKALPQIRELIDRYDPFVMWYDTPQRILLSHSLAFRKVVKENSPSTIICSRIGHELGDYISGRDNASVSKPLAVLWETCKLSAGSWSYNSRVEHYKEKPEEVINVLEMPKDIARQLFEITAGGGVFLLNMGVRMDGSIPDYYWDVWPKVGEWAKVHGKAIYGAGTNPFYSIKPVCTVSGNTLYIYLDAETRVSGTYKLSGLKSNVQKITVMADKKQRSISFSKQGNDLVIELPHDNSFYYGKHELPDLLAVQMKGNVIVDAAANIVMQKGMEDIILEPKYFGSFQGEKDLAKSVLVKYGKRSPVYATFNVNTPGIYNLSMKMSSPNGHGGINVRLRDKLYVIQEHGNASEGFYNQPLGPITFDQAGNYTVLVSSAKFVYRRYIDKYPEDVTRDIYIKNVTLSLVP